MSVVNPQKRNLDLARSDKKEDEIKKDKITNSNAVSFLFFLPSTKMYLYVIHLHYKINHSYDIAT